MGAPEVEKVKSSFKYESTGTVPQLEEDLARIRGIDLVAESWRGRGWLIALPLLIGIPLSAVTLKLGLGPVIFVVSFVATIVLWAVASQKRKLDFENRRYEFANGLLRLINWAPGTQARMGLALRPIETGGRVIGRNGDWTYYQDDWLYLEGQLADGVSLRYARTSYYDSYYFFKQTRSGNTIRTTTSTKKLWHFDDSVTLTFDPARFPDPTRLAAQARDKLGLPKVIEIKHFEGQPGSVTLVVHGAFKWDAAPGAEVKGALDAVPFAGLLIGSLYAVLDAAPQVDLSRSGALPPPRAIIPKAPLTPKEYAIVGVAGVLALTAAGLLLHANQCFKSSDDADRLGDYFTGLAKAGDACQRKTPRSSACDNPTRIAEQRRNAKRERETAEEEWDSGILFVIAGSVAAALSLGGLITWLVLRKKRLIREAAEAEAAGAAMTGADATPPPLGQQPAPQQGPWQPSQQQMAPSSPQQPPQAASNPFQEFQQQMGPATPQQRGPGQGGPGQGG